MTPAVPSAIALAIPPAIPGAMIVRGGGGVSPLVAHVRAVVSAAPVRTGGIRYMDTAPTISIQADGIPPPFSFVRHWIHAPGGNNGAPDLGDVAYCHNIENWAPVFGGGVTFNSNDNNGQSKTTFFRTKTAVDDDISYGTEACIAFTLTGRRFAVPAGRSGLYSWQMEVDGELVEASGPAIQSPDTGARYAVIDFGTTASRDIVLYANQDCWVAELVTEVGDTIVPLLPDDGSFRVSFATDSYGQSTTFVNGGLPFLMMIGRKLGARSIYSSSIGATGYSKDHQSEPADYPRFIKPARREMFYQAPADVYWFALGLNDGWPSSANPASPGPASVNTAEAIESALNECRALNPEAIVIVQTPWAPNEPWAQNPAGAIQSIRTHMIGFLATFEGPWIFLDNVNGTWANSKGAGGITEGGVNPWITGNGSVSSPNSSGNSDIYISDGTHLSNAGMAYASERCAIAVAAAIMAL